MRDRCYKTGLRDYKYYGGKGVTICDRWRNSFDAFLADMGQCPPGHTLDRIDSSGNYEPGNCRWATTRQQNCNTSRNLYVDFRGRRLALVEAVELSGLPYSTVQQRITRLGWTPDRALTQPHRLQGGQRA